MILKIDFLNCVYEIIGTLFFLAAFHFIYKIGEGIFYGNLVDEIRAGVKF